jgi:hypothetical protein
MRKFPLGKLALTFFGCLAFAPIPHAGQRMPDEGDLWFRWNQTERENYVSGYVGGYVHGFADSCSKAVHELHFNSAPPQADPLQKCFDGDKHFPFDIDELVEALTEFYTRYPDVHDIMPNEVLDQLGNGLTLDEIHKYPFFRHDPPAN